VLLSATPINLANDDLYYLLRLCDPDHFQYPSSFKEMLAGESPIGTRARCSVAAQLGSVEEIMTHVQGRRCQRPAATVSTACGNHR
jgi:hypothetical protein